MRNQHTIAMYFCRMYEQYCDDLQQARDTIIEPAKCQCQTSGAIEVGDPTEMRTERLIKLDTSVKAKVVRAIHRNLLKIKEELREPILLSAKDGRANPYGKFDLQIEETDFYRIRRAFMKSIIKDLGI